MALNLFYPRSPCMPCRILIGMMPMYSSSGLHHTTSISTTTSFILPNYSVKKFDRIFSNVDECLSLNRRSFRTSSVRNRDHGPSTFPSLHPALNLKLDTQEEAEELLYYLRQSERELLYKALRQHLKKNNGTIELDDVKLEFSPKPITRDQIKLLFLCNALPFVGFGILDNLIMILAGEYIDSTVGIILGLSTMAAAGIGNIISDIAGVGLAHYVEFLVAKLFGVRPPPLTAEQWDSSKARWTTNSARAFGLTLGCIIGMFPLLFFDETRKQEKKLQAKHNSE